MHVEHPPGGTYRRGKRRCESRSDGEVGHEVPVHDIHMKDAGTGGDQAIDVCPRIQEIDRHDGGENFGCRPWAHPVSLTTAARNDVLHRIPFCLARSFGKLDGMPTSSPRDSTIAIVGDGFGSLIVHSTAMYLGFTPQDLAVYGPSHNPVGTYQQFAFNLGQTVLRSESESHFLPADWPTFGQLDAWSRRSIRPLVRSIGRKYNPGVPEILAEAGAVARETGWEDVRVPTRIGWVQREENPAHFVLYDEEARMVGRAKHVMLALGHGPLIFPPVLARAKASDPEIDGRIVQAYDAKQYHPDGRYIVIGAGIASINEWANIIDAGAKVIALRRNPAPDEQDLNVPRCLFEAKGIDVFQALPFETRLAFLGSVLKGTTPRRRGWLERIELGRAEGRFEELTGEIDTVERGPAGLRVHVGSEHGPPPGWLDITGVVAGTGFNKSALTLPLLRRLVEFYDIPVDGGRIRLQSNCGVPRLDRPESRLAMMGINANTVVPHGDTIAGLKYIGRRFVADVARAERLRKRSFASRVAMQVSLANTTAGAIRTVRRTEQLA